LNGYIVRLQIKAKFAEVYGLPHPGSISFRFDGELIEDDACPGEIGLEDEDLIDAQVPRMLFICVYLLIGLFDASCFWFMALF
jgi:hypothetical protein